MMLAKFRQQYPQGSLVGELVKIDRGTYIVKVLLQVDGVVLATALAGANTVEAAEDAARARAIAALMLDSESLPDNTTNRANLQVATADTTEPPTPAIAQKTPEIVKEEIVKEPQKIPQSVNFSEAEPIAVSPAPSFTPDVPAVETPSAPLKPQPIADAPVASGTLFDDAFTAEPEIPLAEDSYAVASEPQPEADPSFNTAELEAMDFNEIKQKTDIEIKRLGWTKDDGREFLKSRYGKRSRLHLTDEQLLEFLHYLEKLPSPVS